MIRPPMVSWRIRPVLFAPIVFALVIVVPTLLIKRSLDGLQGHNADRLVSGRIPIRRSLDGLQGHTADRLVSDRIRIALVVAAKSKPNEEIANTSVVSIFMPSFARSVADDPAETFEYDLYFGYDVGDPLYDDAGNLDDLRRIVLGMAAANRIAMRLLTFAYDGVTGKPVHVWNRLARSAFDDGCHYFYQLNDDIVFRTAGWASMFVQVLSANPVYKNLGVVGPNDPNLPGVLTQAFVSRVHFFVFHTLYPNLFVNWFSDNWITDVYFPEHLVILPDVQINNVNMGGSRYAEDRGAQAYLELLVLAGKRDIDEFLLTHQRDRDGAGDPIAKRDAYHR